MIGRGTRCCFYGAHARREAGKRKCQYALALLSILFIVLVSAVSFTIANRASAIFLQQAESDSGQIDMTVTASGNPAVNYTAWHNANVGTDGAYSSWRFRYPARIYAASCTTAARGLGFDVSLLGNSTWMYTGLDSCTYDCLPAVCFASRSASATLLVADSRREAIMDLGRHWVLPAPGTMQAYVSSAVATALRLRAGDTVPLSVVLPTATADAAVRGAREVLHLQSAGEMSPFSYRDARSAEFEAKYADYYGNTTDIHTVPVETYLSANTSVVLDVALSIHSRVSAMVRIAAVVDDWEGRLASTDTDIIYLEYARPIDDTGAYLPLSRTDVMEAFAATQGLPAAPAAGPDPRDDVLWRLWAAAHPNLLERNVTRLAELSGTSIQTKDEPYPLLPLPPTAFLMLSLDPLPLHEYASEVLVNLPPPRSETYITSNYDALQKEVVTTMSASLFRSGFDSVSTSMPVIDAMEPLKMFSLFLGLIMSIILTILCVLALMLIYSLMMISVETRTFELAVHRMAGLGRLGVVNLLLTQALSYAIPAWVVGLILAQVIGVFVINMLSDAVGIPLDTSLDGTGVLVASLLGLLLPLLAAVLPIRHALATNVHEALDVEHHRAATTEVTIERAQDQQMSASALILGAGMAICGFLVFYLLPLSLISLDLALFFNIFFAILIGMLFGLILLALNLQHMLERLVLAIVFVWERNYVTAVVRKNLTAHAGRNRKTTLMYALSMAFVIFITVAYTTELNASVATKERDEGADFTMESSSRYLSAADVVSIEAVLDAHAAHARGRASTDIMAAATAQTADSGVLPDSASASGSSGNCVRDWAWVSADFRLLASQRELRSTNDGNYYEHTLDLRGVSPSFAGVGVAKYNIEYTRDNPSGLSLTQALYSARGSQAWVVDRGLHLWTGLDGVGRGQTLKLQQDYTDDLVVRRVQPLAVLESMSGTTFTKNNQFSSYMALASIPTILAMSGDDQYRAQRAAAGETPLASHRTAARSTQSLLWDRLMIDTDGSAACQASLAAALVAYGAPVEVDVWQASDATTDNQETLDMLDLVFTILTWLTLALCLFSLTATTYCNVLGSAPEIAVLRALGATKFAIVRATLAEAFVLVTSSALLGTVIGFVMAWTMLLQRILFTQLPIAFTFPYDTVWTVLVAALLSAAIACSAPLLLILKKTVSATFKTFL